MHLRGKYIIVDDVLDAVTQEDVITAAELTNRLVKFGSMYPRVLTAEGYDPGGENTEKRGPLMC